MTGKVGPHMGQDKYCAEGACAQGRLYLELGEQNTPPVEPMWILLPQGLVWVVPGGTCQDLGQVAGAAASHRGWRPDVTSLHQSPGHWCRRWGQACAPPTPATSSPWLCLTLGSQEAHRCSEGGSRGRGGVGLAGERLWHHHSAKKTPAEGSDGVLSLRR